MSIKALHSFTITLQQKVNKTSTTEENGQSVTRSYSVTEPVTHTIVLKDPSRREKADLSLFQSQMYNDAIEKKLKPRLVIQQQLGPGVALSEEEDPNLKAIGSRSQEIIAEYNRLAAIDKESGETEETRSRREKLAYEYLLLQKKAVEIRSAYQTALVNHTAENYTQLKTLAWLTLFLSHRQVHETRYEPLFNGADFAAKENHSIDLEDGGDALYAELIKNDERTGLPKLAQYWMAYLFNRASTPKEFGELEKDWDKQYAAEQKMKEEAREEAKKVDEVAAKPAAPVPETPSSMDKPVAMTDADAKELQISSPVS